MRTASTWWAACETAEDLLLAVRDHSPDVAIVDIRLPPTHNDEGLRAAIEIRANHPATRVLVLSQYVELGLAMKLLADSAEGAGYLLKDRISDVKEFIAAFDASRTAAPPSTRSSSRPCSRNAGATTRSTSSHPENAKCSS